MSRRRRLNEPDELQPSAAQSLMLGSYMRRLNELYANGGIHSPPANGHFLEVTSDELQRYTYFALASMTPEQISALYTPDEARFFYYVTDPDWSNFSEAVNNDDYDYYELMIDLLTFTNENGVLTGRSTEHGQRLAEAFSSIRENAVNEYEPTIVADGDEEDDIATVLDEDEQREPNANANNRQLVRQDNRRTDTIDDAWEIHNYAKNINKKDLINYLQNYVNGNSTATEFRRQGLEQITNKYACLIYIKTVLNEFIDKYVDVQDRQEYKEGLDTILNQCLANVDFTKIGYDTIRMSEFIVLIFAFVQGQPANFIDSYVRGIIKETTGSYTRGDRMSCPKGAWERFWTTLGDLAQTFESEPVYKQNKYLELYSIINNIYHIDIPELLNQFTNDWYKQLQMSTDEPTANNREINIDYYRNYVTTRFNNHLDQMFPQSNGSLETAEKINEYKTEFLNATNERIQNPPPELDEAFDYVYKSTSVGGKRKSRRNKKKYSKKRANKKSKSFRKRKTLKKRVYKRYTKKQQAKKYNNNNKQYNKSIANQKAGFMKELGFEINGLKFNKITGDKRYNWETGKWDPVDCYQIGPFPPLCKIRKS